MNDNSNNNSPPNEKVPEKVPVAVNIDYETGEIIDTIYEGDKLKIVTHEQLQYFQHYVPNADKGRPFIKLYTDTIDHLTNILTMAELRFVIKLTPFVSYNDCVIRKTTNSASDIATIADMAESTNEEYENIRKIIRQLINKNVLAKHNTTDVLSNYFGKKKYAYTVNPFIFFKGSSVNKFVYNYYSKLQIQSNQSN